MQLAATRQVVQRQAVKLQLPSQVHAGFCTRTVKRGRASNNMFSSPAVGAPGAASSAVPEVYQEPTNDDISRFQEHQKTAARPSAAEHARTLMTLARHGVLCTLSSHKASGGFPFGSVVEFAVDHQGQPILSTSTLSPHTADLAADGRCSVTVMAPEFKSLQDARFTLTGTAKPLTDESERAAARETYLSKYPNAFYVDFGDFRWFRVEDITGGRYVGGFGRVASVTAADYIAASPDPVAKFSEPVCKHMNADHQGDILAMVKYYVGLSVDSAKMLDLDRLGTTLECQRGPTQTFKVRLPFIWPAEDRKSVKDVIVEMTKTAKAAANTASSS
eukprot:jgi/Chrzof1/8227/Cz03g02070.t1